MTDQTRTGAKIQDFRAAKPKAFATQDGSDERNPVFDKRKKTKLNADYQGPSLSKYQLFKGFW